MNGQAGGLEALVTLLAFLFLLCVVFGVGAWWSNHADPRTDDEDYGTYTRDRIGR